MLLEKVKKEAERALNMPVRASVLEKLTKIAKEQGYYNRKEFLDALFDKLIEEWESK